MPVGAVPPPHAAFAAPPTTAVPIVVEPTGPQRLVFTVRPRDLPTHAGQISFPGGKREEHDADAVATALRECEEEVGFGGASVTVLGLLDDVPTPSGFVITPVVARLAGPIVLAPNREVAEAMIVPLDALRGPAYRNGGDIEWLGFTWAMHEYDHGGRTIWGATARIVWQLLRVIDGLPDGHVPSDRAT